MEKNQGPNTILLQNILSTLQSIYEALNEINIKLSNIDKNTKFTYLKLQAKINENTYKTLTELIFEALEKMNTEEKEIKKEKEKVLVAKKQLPYYEDDL